MAAGTLIAFARHGETEANRSKVITAAAPGHGLTKTGVAQAQSLGRGLQGELFDRVLASPLRRAGETAAIVVGTAGFPNELEIDPRLAESNVGDLEGRGDPAAFEHFDSAHVAWYEDSRLDEPCGPGGETAVELTDRMRDFIRDVVRRGDDRVLAVTHATFLRVSLWRLCDNVTLDMAYRNRLPNCSVVRVVSDGERFECVSWAGFDAGPAAQ